MKKFVRVLGNCLVTSMIIVLFVNIIINFFSKNDGVAKIGNYSFFDVNGDSMYPKLKNGDFIVVDVRKKDKYLVNDIISFKMVINGENVIVTHMIEEVVAHGYGYKYVTKGINNDYNDKKIVGSEEIIGLYKNIRIPILGYIVRFSRSIVGYLLLVMVPLGSMLFWASYELINEFCKKKEEV